jgi:hypothetical protein
MIDRKKDHIITMFLMMMKIYMVTVDVAIPKQKSSQDKAKKCKPTVELEEADKEKLRSNKTVESYSIKNQDYREKLIKTQAALQMAKYNVDTFQATRSHAIAY